MSGQKNIIKHSDLDIKNVSFTDIKKNPKTKKLESYINYNGKAMFIRTPWMRAPFAMSIYKKDDASQSESQNPTVMLSFDEENKDKLNKFKNDLIKIDKAFLEHIVKNSKLIWDEDDEDQVDMYNGDMKVIKSCYKGALKVGKMNKETNIRNPDSIRPKIYPVYLSKEELTENTVRKPNANFYKQSGEEIEVESMEDLLDENIFPKNTEYRVLMRPKAWITQEKISLNYQVVQLQFKEKETAENIGFAFGDDEDDRNDGNSSFQGSEDNQDETNKESNNSDNENDDAENKDDDETPDSDGEYEEIEEEIEEVVEVGDSDEDDGRESSEENEPEPEPVKSTKSTTQAKKAPSSKGKASMTKSTASKTKK